MRILQEKYLTFQLGLLFVQDKFRHVDTKIYCENVLHLALCSDIEIMEFIFFCSMTNEKLTKMFTNHVWSVV